MLVFYLLGRKTSLRMCDVIKLRILFIFLIYFIPNLLYSRHGKIYDEFRKFVLLNNIQYSHKYKKLWFRHYFSLARISTEQTNVYKAYHLFETVKIKWLTPLTSRTGDTESMHAKFQNIIRTYVIVKMDVSQTNRGNKTLRNSSGNYSDL